MTVYTILYSFPNFEPVCCSASSSHCCWLIHLQVSLETGQALQYPHILKNFPQFAVIHTVKGFTIVNESGKKFFFFFYCNCLTFSMIPWILTIWSGSSAFSKSCLYFWKLSDCVPLNPNLKEVGHYLAHMWNEHNAAVVWTFFVIVLLWDWNESDLFLFCDHCWVFQSCWHIACSPLTASFFFLGI